MRNPGTDFHRREADEQYARGLSARKRQLAANAAAWLKRGNVRMATLEDPNASFSAKAAIRDALAHETLSAVFAPSNSPSGVANAL